MRTFERRRRFRTLLQGTACVAPASVYDPLSARAAEDLGFEAGVLAGSVASMAVTGLPDLMGLTLTELSGLTQRICRAGELPLIVDADDGYGNALHVRRTVEELETAGAAAMTLEDTLLPLPFGRPAPDSFISLPEGLGRLRAALEARSDPDFVIVARTAVAPTLGLAECLTRLAAYAAAGADALFPIGLKTRPELERLRRELPLPLCLFIETAELYDPAWLATQGVRLAWKGNAPFAAATTAAHATLAALRGGPPAPLSPDPELLRRLSRQAEQERRLAAYMT